MSTFALVIGLVVLLSGSAAQVAVEEVWSVVSYLYHGEHTPLNGSNSASLTPLGAQQMYSQGKKFRSRYLSDSSADAEQSDTTTSALIEGIESMAIDNTQLSIVSTSDPYISTGALAFLQALYPPLTQAFANNSGGLDAALLANGSLINYPMDGYQYPNLEIPSVLDPNSIWVEGHLACARHSESAQFLFHDPMANLAYDQSLGFYKALWAKVFSAAFPLQAASFYNAYELYAYASYKYNHDNETQAKMSAADLSTLADLASTQQRFLNGNLGSSEPTQEDVARTIAGRTLAANVLSRFGLNMASSGSLNKLNLMFGPVEPFVAFFAVSRLINGPSGNAFVPLPGLGAAMAFELFSMRRDSSAYPSIDDLWVRFLYRNDSRDETPFIEYPLFGNGNSQSRMRLADFVTAVEGLGVTGVAQWCNVCDSTNLFCSALEENSSDGTEQSSGMNTGGKQMSGVVAGVIGAVVMAAVLALAALLAVVVGRVRFYRDGRDRRSSACGGFKGPEKMRSDVDVTYTGSGAQHERTGSWQLREGQSAGEGAVAAPAGVVLKTPDPVGFRARPREEEDDDTSVAGHEPVSPLESV